MIIFLLTLTSAIYAQSGIPTLPALCYGELRINGNLAPVGTTVIAKVDNIARGSLTSTETGKYGGPGLQDKLTISGDNLSGKMVRFYVSGSYGGVNFSEVYAGQELYWGSGEVKQIDLGVTVSGTSPTPTPSPGTSPTPTPSPGTSPTPAPSPVPAPPAVDGIRPGDITGDGYINVLDVSLTMQFALGLKTPTENEKKAADVNRDGVVNVADVTLILKYALRLIDSFN